MVGGCDQTLDDSAKRKNNASKILMAFRFEANID
jgi:hypothetical protein